MARHLRPCTAQLYDAATRWRIDCLDSDGSLLSTGRSVWTADVLEELAGCLVVSADEREGSFITKLKAQLADASADAVQLTAELHIVHFLIWWTEGSGSISYATKRSQLDEILSWRPDSPAVPDQVDELLRCGIVRMGQHALSKRYTQLNYLIQLARTWKRLPSADKRTYATDPWSFRELAETIDAPSSDAQRLAIQYLLFPDTFEPIVNANHKQLIIDRYRDVANGERDVDRALLSIRASLEPAWGERFHWYDEPRQRTWNKGERWATFMDWARQFRALPDFDVEERDYKFEAAEVTGNAKHAYVSDQTDWPDLLKRALSSKVQNIVNYMVVSPMLRWINEHPDDARQLFANLWKSEKSVTDRLAEFAAATPPDFATSPGLRINLISYLLMAEDPPNIPPYKATAIKMAWDLAGWKRPPTSNEAETYNWFIALCDEMVHDATAWPLALRDRLDAQSVIWGITKWSGEPTWPPGRWQELLEYRQTASKVIDEDDEDEPADDRRAHGDPAVSVDYLNEAAKRANVDREELAEIVELLKDKRQVIFYGPPGTGKTWVAQELALAIAEDDPDRTELVQFHPAMSYEDFIEGLRPIVTKAGHVSYELTDGHLMRIAKRAQKDPEHIYVLVIDEINRANMPKVLGELLFLLEYRNRSIRPLYRPNERFSLPENLWFIGTMNTADRSIALIDAAMRRRFHFKPFFPHEPPVDEMLERWLTNHQQDTSTAAFLDAVNGELLKDIGEHLLIGPSHFMRGDLSEKAFERIWTYNIFPLLEELFWGQPADIAHWRWPAVRARHGALIGLATLGTASEDADGTADPFSGL